MSRVPDIPPVEPISVRISDAVRLTGLGRSRIYELIKCGEIEFIKVGRVTLLPYESLRALVERRRPGSRSQRGTN